MVSTEMFGFCFGVWGCKVCVCGGVCVEGDGRCWGLCVCVLVNNKVILLSIEEQHHGTVIKVFHSCAKGARFNYLERQELCFIIAPSITVYLTYGAGALDDKIPHCQFRSG